MFSNPDKNIDQFSLGDGMYVADFGAGSGAYTLAAARAVGGDGKVYAIDVRQETLAKIKKEATEKSLHNVEVLRGDLERTGGSGLRDGAVDAVIVSNILFQIQDKKAFVSEIRRVLRPTGRVLLVEWSASFGGVGPQAEMVVREETARALFLENGFSLQKTIDAGAQHYGLIFKRG